MQSTNINDLIDTILRNIKRGGGCLSFREIKRSISIYNVRGGTAALRKLLTQMVTEGNLSSHTKTASNGKLVEYYSINKAYHESTVESFSDNSGINSSGNSGNNGTIQQAIKISLELPPTPELWIQVSIVDAKGKQLAEESLITDVINENDDALPDDIQTPEIPFINSDEPFDPDPNR